MPKILIIGSRGMLGSMLARIFSKSNEIIAWDKNEIDITRREDSIQRIQTLNPEYIVNCAAYTAVDDCETHKELAMSVNAEGPKNLALAAKNLDVPLIHYSTDYVFDGTKKEGYKENDKTGAISVYGKSKEMAEKYIQNIAPKHYIIRISSLFGPNGKNWVDTIAAIAKTKPKLTIVSDQRHKPTYTRDVALSTQSLIAEHKKLGIYHMPNEPETTWLEFAKAIVSVLDLQTAIEPISAENYFKDKPHAAKRPKYSSLINTKLLLSRPWKDALAEYLK